MEKKIVALIRGFEERLALVERIEARYNARKLTAIRRYKEVRKTS
jgi:hypothetical protein